MLRERRNREEWKAIFVAQQSSGVTARGTAGSLKCIPDNVGFIRSDEGVGIVTTDGKLPAQ